MTTTEHCWKVDKTLAAVRRMEDALGCSETNMTRWFRDAFNGYGWEQARYCWSKRVHPTIHFWCKYDAA